LRHTQRRNYEKGPSFTNLEKFKIFPLGPLYFFAEIFVILKKIRMVQLNRSFLSISLPKSFAKTVLFIYFYKNKHFQQKTPAALVFAF
jgi:hypothetical protein